MKKIIDFDYAFGAPHTMTLARPSSSKKTICEVSEEGIKFLWTYQSLKDKYPLAWTMMPFDVKTFLNVSVDGEGTVLKEWGRGKSGIPMLCAQGGLYGVNYKIDAIAGKRGVVVKVTFNNIDDKEHLAFVAFSHLDGWVISNKGWIDEVNYNILLTMNQGRADRYVAYATGADSYPVYKLETMAEDGCVPFSNSEIGIREDSMKKITMKYVLKPRDTKVGYIYLPDEEYFENTEKIRKIDFEKEINTAIKEWDNLINRSATFMTNDEDLENCVKTCISELFVMREKIGKRNSGITCGTSHYRAPNSGEPLIAEIVLDSLGYQKEAYEDYKMYLDVEEPDGCWLTRKGWEHEGWACCFNKARAVLEHYYMTDDLDFLKKYYPKMKASTLFNNACRQKTKNDKDERLRGLMIRGMGDSGQMCYSDFYGVFFTSNIRCLAADKLTVEAAKILGLNDDVKMLTLMCEEAEEALLKSIRENPIQEDGYQRIANIPNAPSTSIYGCFDSYYPADMLSKDDPLIAGTIKYVKSKKTSDGGLPLGTGWLKDGVWAGMALYTFSRTYLRMGMYEDATKYLYSVLNHASPFVTWCEERGSEKGSMHKTGDMQHLWTPLAVVMYMIDAMIHDWQGEVHLFSGLDESWIDSGKSVGFKNLYSVFGKTSAQLNYGKDIEFVFNSERSVNKKVVVHYIHNEERKQKQVNLKGKTYTKIILEKTN